MDKIVEVIKNDGRSVECIIEYKNGERMTHYMTVESYNQKVVFAQMMEKYGISETDMNIIEGVVVSSVQRDNHDDERDEW